MVRVDPSTGQNGIYGRLNPTHRRYGGLVWDGRHTGPDLSNRSFRRYRNRRQYARRGRLDDLPKGPLGGLLRGGHRGGPGAGTAAGGGLGDLLKGPLGGLLAGAAAGTAIP